VVPLKSKAEKQRILAVQRFHNGEKPESIWISFGKSKAWLYKWVGRQENLDNESWYCDRSRQPLNNANKTPLQILKRR